MPPMETAAPAWVDPAAYPFRSRWIEIDGHRMHYLDEGEGPALVMVHGTPTWSFLYRSLIADLSSSYRVVAPDHLGFGLSEKPEGWGYRPADHARNLATLIERLGLEEVTLVVHDFGGPIGLSYAVRNPDAVPALVIFNSWMWSLEGTPAEKLSRLMGSAVGRFLYRRLNLSPRVLIPAAFGDRRKLTKEAHRHYLEAFGSPAAREGAWVLARELIGSSDWYEGLWAERERIAGKPALLLWGMKDPAFGPEALARWRGALERAEVVEFPDAGHFVMEEEPPAAAREIRSFLSRALAPSA